MYNRYMKSLILFGLLTGILCFYNGDSNIWGQDGKPQSSPVTGQLENNDNGNTVSPKSNLPQFVRPDNIIPPDKEDLIIVSMRPLYDASLILEQIYRKPVTVEGPIERAWDGDIEMKTVPSGRVSRDPKTVKFVMPEEVITEKNQQLDIGILEKVLEAFHKQTDGPRYKITISRHGFHLITDEVKDKNGQYIKENQYLDTVITVPVGKRTALEHIKEITDAVSASRERKLWINTGLGFDTDFFPPGTVEGRGFNPEDRDKLIFEWGIDNVIGRDALIDLFEKKSNTTFTWWVACADSIGINHECMINIGPLEVSSLFPDGTTKGRVALWGDKRNPDNKK